MSEPFFDPVRGGAPAGDEQQPWTSFLDPTLVRVDERERWETRAAQWRARALAEVVFGGEVEARLSAQTHGPFRGLLHLDVPFVDLAEHRARERVFLAAIGIDPVLARVPFVFVFGARAELAR